MKLKETVINVIKQHANQKVGFNFSNRKILLSSTYDNVALEDINQAIEWYKDWINGKIEGFDPPTDGARKLVQRLLDEVSLKRNPEGFFSMVVSGTHPWTISVEGKTPITIHG